MLTYKFFFHFFSQHLATDMKDPELKFWTTSPNIFLVALTEDSQKVVGCISYRKIASDTVEMHRTAVDMNSQGLGIGKKLVHALEERAKSEGFLHMYLETSTPQVAAWKMYEKCGFQFLRYLPMDVPIIDQISGVSVVGYVKKL